MKTEFSANGQDDDRRA